MRQRRICKADDCDKPALKGAFMCEDHLAQKRRCEGRVRTYNEQTGEVLTDRQCKKAARPGLKFCQHHGGSGPKSTEVSMRTAALTAMQRFVQPYQGSLDPVSAFEMEFRRTYGRILWLEEQIAALESVEDLVWGKTKEEHVNATEFAGTNKTYEARIHVFEEMLRWERKHFLDMEKVWIGAKLDERRLSMMRSQIDYTYSLVVKAATALGHDVNSDEVRTIIGRLFERELAAEQGALESRE